MDNFTLNEDIQAKLFQYQVPHVVNLCKSLVKHNRALDCSDTGTGKTFGSIALCAQLGLKPLVICPKSVISSWTSVITDIFKIDYYGVTNYETIHNCRMFKNDKKIDCPFIKRIKLDVEEKEDKKGKKVKKERDPNEEADCDNKYTFQWAHMPQDLVVIFDESHRCKNRRTLNSILLYTLCKSVAKVLMISATVCDSLDNFSLTGFALGLYNKLDDLHNWLRTIENNPNDNPMKTINGVIFNDYASRMKIRDLGRLFPDNQIVAECYDMDVAEEIEREYKLIEAEVERLHNKEINSASALAAILYARMRIEMLKVPTYVEEAQKYLAEENSVAIFVNFTQTLTAIADRLNTTTVIHGQQSKAERDKAIKDFVSDKSQVIVCNMRSGGVGISLHDINGNYPRVSIISPGWSAQDILQALGRIHRANGKTPVRQRIMFCKNTIEEKVCHNMKERIKNIAMLNDGDMLSYNIEGLTDDPDGITNEDTKEMNEIDLLFMKINVLNIRKERLQNEITDVTKQISEHEEKIYKLLGDQGFF